MPHLFVNEESVVVFFEQVSNLRICRQKKVRERKNLRSLFSLFVEVTKKKKGVPIRKVLFFFRYEVALFLFIFLHLCFKTHFLGGSF